MVTVVAPPGLTLPETVEEGNIMTMLPWVVEPHMVIEVGPAPPPRVQLPDRLPPLKSTALLTGARKFG